MGDESGFQKLIVQISDEIEKFNQAMYDLPELDGYYNEHIIKAIKQERPKLSKKERLKFELELLKEKCPGFVKLMDQIDVLAQAMEDRLETTRERLEDVEEKLGEIEELKDEIEDRKSELDM